MFSDLFLFRYGNTWTPWRRCGFDYDDAVQDEMLELEPSSEEAISSVSGYSGDSTGSTVSLFATTTARRSFQHPTWKAMFGKHGGGKSNSPDAELRLPFLSGDQTDGNYILR